MKSLYAKDTNISVCSLIWKSVKLFTLLRVKMKIPSQVFPKNYKSTTEAPRIL